MGTGLRSVQRLLVRITWIKRCVHITAVGESYSSTLLGHLSVNKASSQRELGSGSNSKGAVGYFRTRQYPAHSNVPVQWSTYMAKDYHIWMILDTTSSGYCYLPARPRTAADCFGLEVTLIIILRVFTMTWIDVICPLFVRQLFDMSARPKGKVLLRAKSLVEPDVQNPFSYRLQLTAWDKVKVSSLRLNMLKFRNTFPVLDLTEIFKAMEVWKMLKY